MISRTGAYGLRALLYMVSYHREPGYINIRHLAEQLGISFFFLTKILHELTSNGILQSHKGPNGGVVFCIPPDQLRLTDILRILEGPDFFERCFLGFEGCGEQKPCPVHDIWKNIRTQMLAEFDRKPLSEWGIHTLAHHFRLTS